MIGKIVVITLLFGLFFLKFQILVIVGLFLSGLFFILLLSRKWKIDKVGFIIILNFIYWLLSGFISGGIEFKDFMNPAFISGDGRIFLYYLPLLCFSVYSAKYEDLFVLLKILYIISALSFILFILWRIWKPIWLFGNTVDFIGFLTSHTGAGTFWGSILIFLMVYGYITKDKKTLFFAFLTIFPFIASASRQSLFGIYFTSLWYILKSKKPKIIFKFATFTLLILLLIPIAHPRMYERIKPLLSKEYIDDIFFSLNYVKSWEPHSIESFSNLSVKKIYATSLPISVSNSISRLLFWGYAIKKFLESPIVGIGFGRFNDLNLEFYGINHIFYIAYKGKRILVEKTAHNSYLHILAESGLIGLFLLLAVWILMYKRFEKGRYITENKYLKGYFMGCQALIVFSLTNALYGHALAAPSLGLIVLTIIGIGLSIIRRLKKEKYLA